MKMFVSIIAENKKTRSYPGGSSRVRQDIENSLGYSRIITLKNKGKKTPPPTSFYIGTKLTKKARFILGDKLDVLYDKESGLGLIKRMLPTQRGNTLTHSGQKKGHTCSAYGLTVGPKYFDFPYTESTINLENVTIDDEGILFSWPKGKTYKQALEDFD
jgi:hypothetical protein